MNNNFETNFEMNFETRFNPDGTWNREHEFNYSAILELDKRLTEDGIPHLIDELMDGWVIIYFDDEGNRIGDVIEHCGSYGHEQNLMEAMGFNLDDVKGYLSIEEAFALFQEAHKGVE